MVYEASEGSSAEGQELSLAGALVALRATHLPILTAQEQNPDKFPRLERLKALAYDILYSPPDTAAFWSQYKSTEQFDFLKRDLLITDKEDLALWQLYFDYYNGSGIEKLAATAQFFRAKLPWPLTVPLKNITEESIQDKIKVILDDQCKDAPSLLWNTKISDYDNALEKENKIDKYISNIEALIISDDLSQKGTHTITRNTDPVSTNNPKISSQTLSVESAHCYAQVIQDLRLLSQQLNGQIKVLYCLDTIQHHIDTLGQLGLRDVPLQLAFDKEVDWAYQNYITRLGLSEPCTISRTTNEKISVMNRVLRPLAYEFNKLLEEKETNIISTLQDFMSKRENPWSIAGLVHRLLSMCSSAYKELFEALAPLRNKTNTAVEVEEIVSKSKATSGFPGLFLRPLKDSLVVDEPPSKAIPPPLK